MWCEDVTKIDTNAHETVFHFTCKENAMTYEQFFSLKSDKPIEVELLIKLAESLRQANIKMYPFDSKAHIIQETQKLIRERGLRHILSLKKLEEEVLPKVAIDKRPLLAKIVSSQLSKLSPQHSLIIIDPYFFAEKNIDSYLEIFNAIFDPVINSIQEMLFITNTKFNTVLVDKVKDKLSNINNKLTISHKTTDIFHDRFWIVDYTKGMFVGTSINGIGKKYALTDYIRTEDITEIMQELKINKLV